MSGKNKMLAVSALLAVLLASVMIVPAMATSGEQLGDRGLDIVDQEIFRERPPSFISELRNRGYSEEDIAEKIVSSPRVTYLGNWTAEDDKRMSPLLQKGRVAVNYSMYGDYSNEPTCSLAVNEVMSISGIWLRDTVFQGIYGMVHPGPMECSSSGTNYQYLTTHLGKKIGTAENWIEIGVETVSWSPGHYYIFTYDNNDVGNEWITHYDLTEGNQDYSFEIYVSSSSRPEGYPYMISWQGKVVRTGFVPFAEGDLNEVHEYIRNDPGSFSDVSTSYMCDSYVYYDGYGVWWNEQLDAQLEQPTFLSQNETEGVYGDFYVPGGSHAYKIDTWIG